MSMNLNLFTHREKRIMHIIKGKCQWTDEYWDE